MYREDKLVTEEEQNDIYFAFSVSATGEYELSYVDDVVYDSFTQKISLEYSGQVIEIVFRPVRTHVLRFYVGSASPDVLLAPESAGLSILVENTTFFGTVTGELVEFSTNSTIH